MAFDSLPYVNLLLRDLGLKTHRKGGRGWREWFVPYGQSDYRELVREWTEGIEARREQMSGKQHTAKTR